MHWRQPRRGCRGHIPQYFGWGDVNGNIPPPILLRTFGYSRPILVALRSLSLKPFSFGYKTPPIRFSPFPHPTTFGGSSPGDSPNLELALTPLSTRSSRPWGRGSTSVERRHWSAVSGAPSMERELIERCVGRAPSVER